MDNRNSSLDSFKDSETPKAKSTVSIERTSPNSLSANNINKLKKISDKEISDKIDALQRAVSRLTYQVAKALEERHNAAMRAREGRW
jgi:hypothetical protein